MRPRMGSGGALAAMLGVVAALLVSCGGSTAKLIPTANAGPLQSDFEAVAHAAETGSGNCAATEAAIAKTEGDFNGLPTSVDTGLRETLRNGIDNLRSHALALCAQPLAQTTATNTTTKTTAPTTTTPTTTTPTTTTPAQTTTTPTTTPIPTETTPGAGGGTAAPGVGEEPVAPGGGTGAGEGASGNGETPPGTGTPGQEPSR
jgi:hypothetical protein